MILVVNRNKSTKQKNYKLIYFSEEESKQLEK